MAIKKSDIYRSLWDSCDQLRGGMDASLYKDYILTALLHNSGDGRGYPLPGQTYPTASVTGMPSAV
ncbi:SAM-dependent DNA methyltransferase (plasmid) [Paracoccus ferrooxidans]|nr:SAM-dependent DNA methyltransferase [Paracoccus ferrooxidans]